MIKLVRKTAKNMPAELEVQRDLQGHNNRKNTRTIIKPDCKKGTQ